MFPRLAPRRLIVAWISAALGGLLLLAAPVSAFASPATKFIERSLTPYDDQRDSLAAGFDTHQLPLLAAAFVQAPPEGVSGDDLYSALTRWHYYAGRKFDPDRTGLWNTTTAPASATLAPPAAITLATESSLELVELASLARLATRQGHVFDPIVWWYDHLALGQRLVDRLYNPLQAAYSGLDSLGRQEPDATLSGLIPIALGAPHGGETTRRTAWKLWTGRESPPMPDDLSVELAARERAEAFEPWSANHGLHVVSPGAMAALSLQALDALDEPALKVIARDALASRGLYARGSIDLRIGSWKLEFPLRDLRPEPLERSTAALHFLKEVGVFSSGRADSLLALVAGPGDSTTVAIDKLTDLLVELRGTDVRRVSDRWALQREGRNDIDPQGRAAFRFQYADLAIWFGRSLDLITADILAWHLRPDYHSKLEVSLDPPLAGQGDRTTLIVDGRAAHATDNLEARPLTLMWTDGTRLLPPFMAQLRRTGDRELRAELSSMPLDTGLWHLVVEGMPERARIPAALAVVEPLYVELTPVARRNETIDWSLRLRSQIRQPLHGRVDIETPLSWTTAPVTTAPWSLEPGASVDLMFSVTPDQDVTPGTYPLKWTVWGGDRLVGSYEATLDQTFTWLRMGPLPVTDAKNPIDSPYRSDRRVDLAERLPGVEGKAAWTRLPAGHLSPRGFVVLSNPGDGSGIHYAFTGFVTHSREAILELESAGPARLYVNGRKVLSMDRWGGRREQEVKFGSGTNYVVVKLLDQASAGARFRLRARDIDGSPLQGVGNELEHLVENYAYLARAEAHNGNDDQRHVLRLVPIRFQNPTASSVSVVGSFNGWSPNSTPMTRAADGSWQVKIRMRPGRFEYKFAVDGDEWIPDPANPVAVDDGFGGRNSVLVVD